jgi:hypothetical protein
VGLSERSGSVHIDELVLDGIAPGDPRLAGSLAERLGPAFAGRCPATTVARLSTAVAGALTQYGGPATSTGRGQPAGGPKRGV